MGTYTNVAVKVGVLFGVILFATFQHSSGFKCFICNSHYDPGCADWFNNFTYPMKDCGMYGKPNASLCRKMVIEAFYDGDWRWRYHRECANYGEVGPFHGRLCHDRVGTFRVKVRYCHCNNREGCNAAVSTFSSPYSLITLGCCLIIALWNSKMTLS